MKKLFTFFLTLFVASSVWAYDFVVDGNYYDIELNSSVSFVGKYNNYEGSITIPSSVTYGGKTYNVTGIGYMAFFGCSGLTSITIPNSVTSIGEWAFEGCTGLTSVTIPESLDVSHAVIYFTKDGIWYYVLNGKEVEVVSNSYTGNIVIPSSVTAGNTFSVTGIGEWAFEGCTGLTSVTIPNSVTSIGEYAFFDCSGLTSITIPNSVTSIGDGAFEGCTNLREVINQSSMEIKIGSYNNGGVAFYADYVYNGEKVVIGDFIFSKADKQLVWYTGSSANVVLPENFEGGSYTIGSNAFANNTEIQSVTISSGVTSIADYTFKNCTGLTSITIPNSVTSIGGNAFARCDSLKEVINLSSLEITDYVSYYTDVYNGGKIAVGDFMFSKNDKILKKYAGSSANVVLPENFEGDSYTIGSEVFANNTEIQSVTISSGVTSIYAFFDCKEVINLSSLEITDHVSYYTDVYNGGKIAVGDFMFSKNDKILKQYVGSSANVVLPENFEGDSYTIGSKAFANNTEIQSVTISSGVTSIGEGAFSDCSGLTSVTIPNSVTSIEYAAFRGCTGLTSVTIPNSVTSIEDYAFEDCTALSKVTCYAVNPPDVDVSSFSNYNGYLTIPCDNFEAYDIHSVWGSFKHVDCISGEATELQKDEVVVEPEINEAVFSMPTNASANFYTLTIQNNGVTFCTLTFNSQGQLSNIDFSGNTLKASVEGYQFTVTGLSAATDYGYSFKALDKSKSVLKEYTGSFTTKNEDGTGGSSAGGVGTSISDVLDFVDIQVVNNQIYVDGSIVPYVIDIQGKKITNKNLKAGVYFILIDGKTFSVSIQ